MAKHHSLSHTDKFYAVHFNIQVQLGSNANYFEMNLAIINNRKWFYVIDVIFALNFFFLGLVGAKNLPFAYQDVLIFCINVQHILLYWQHITCWLHAIWLVISISKSEANVSPSVFHSFVEITDIIRFVELTIWLHHSINHRGIHIHMIASRPFSATNVPKRMQPEEYSKIIIIIANICRCI